MHMSCSDLLRQPPELAHRSCVPEVPDLLQDGGLPLWQPLALAAGDKLAKPSVTWVGYDHAMPDQFLLCQAGRAAGKVRAPCMLFTGML